MGEGGSGRKIFLRQKEKIKDESMQSLVYKDIQKALNEIQKL